MYSTGSGNGRYIFCQLKIMMCGHPRDDNLTPGSCLSSNIPSIANMRQSVPLKPGKDLISVHLAAGCWGEGGTY